MPNGNRPSPSTSSSSRSRSGGGSRSRSRGPARPSSAPAAPRVSALEAALTQAAALPLPEVADFAQLGLPQALVSTLARRGITTPSPIQVRTLPDALAGRDLLGRAQTGSGKTLGFGLPLLARLSAGTRRGPAPRALVLVPTRELAEQVKEALAPLAQAVALKVTAVYGGASMGRQISVLRGGVDVLVATPGRLEDHLAQGTTHLRDVQVTVLDEADFMADLGFLPVVTRLLTAVPAGGQRLLFSATLDGDVEGLVRRFLDQPALHAVASAAARIDTMDHRAFTVTMDDKVTVAAEIAARPARTLYFVRTKHGADRLAKQISRTGTEAGAIHGNLRQTQRQRALDAFAGGRVRVLVATDVAARGIHVDDVDLVVHYDPPADGKDYLHRSGRTARAGSSGSVVSLFTPEQVRDGERMLAAVVPGTRSQSVGPGHPAVRQVATSGEPVVLTAEPVRAPEPSSAPSGSGRRRGGRPGGASSGARTGAPSATGRSGGSSAGRPVTGRAAVHGAGSAAAHRPVHAHSTSTGPAPAARRGPRRASRPAGA